MVNSREVQSYSQENILKKTDYKKEGSAYRAPAALLKGKKKRKSPKERKGKVQGKKDFGS